MTSTPKGWTKKDENLTAVFKRVDFASAIELIDAAADIAEDLQHHPDIGVVNYNEVHISTTTHSTNTLTDKDYQLAEAISALVDK